MADKQADQRHDDHVQAGNEAGVGDAGKQQADLLQVDAEGQHQAHHGAAEEQAAVAPGLTRNGLFGGGVGQQRHQHQGGEGEAQAGIEEGADMVHAQALGDKRRAPDDRGEQHQDVGTQGLVLHNSTRQAKRQTLPQSAALDHPWMAGHAGRRFPAHNKNRNVHGRLRNSDC